MGRNFNILNITLPSRQSQDPGLKLVRKLFYPPFRLPANRKPLSQIWERGWGEGVDRYTSGTSPTSIRYTGQRVETSLGLYYYGARWYDPALGRFIQADTVVPSTGDPQAWDRFAYVDNNPAKFVDPTGHMLDQGTGGGGIDRLKICQSKDLGVPLNQIRTNTNAILLKGGPGASSYHAAAERRVRVSCL